VRLSGLFFAMVLAYPVAAADWKEYESPDHSFTVHFPTDPNVELTAYRTLTAARSTHTSTPRRRRPAYSS